MSRRVTLDQAEQRLAETERLVERLAAELAEVEADEARFIADLGERPTRLAELSRRDGARDREEVDRTLDIVARNRELQAALREATASGRRASDLVELLRGNEIEDLQTLVEMAEASAPFVLLPARIETRFGDDAGKLVLLVRIFPDDIHGQSQGQVLDAEDERLLSELRTDVVSHGREDAIRLLLGKATPQQAAWVVRHFDDQPPRVTDQPAGAIAWLDLLPTRWAVEVRVDGRTIHRVVSAAIRDATRAVVLDPNNDDAVLTAGWLRDFKKAEELGMAVAIELGDAAAAASAAADPPIDLAESVQPGIDVVVLGVNHELAADEGSEAIKRAMTGHAFGAGLRIMPKGSPTNNTSSARVSADRADREQFDGLVDPPTYPESGSFDAALLEQALGVTEGALASVARAQPSGALLADDEDARAMAIALWPVTQGYSAVEVTKVPPPYGHFTRHVRPGGALPVLAVGSMPYGFHVTGPTDLVPDEDLGRRVLANTPFLGSAPWRTALESTPRVGGGLTPEQFLDIVKLAPSSASFQIRAGQQSMRPPPPEVWEAVIDGRPFPSLQLSSYLPTLVFDVAAAPWMRGLVLDDADVPVPPERYLRDLRGWYRQLRSGGEYEAAPERDSVALLYLLLRYATAMTAAWSEDIPSLRVPEGGSPLLRHLDAKLGFQPGNAGHYQDLDAVREGFRPEGLRGIPSRGLAPDAGTATRQVVVVRSAIDALASRSARDTAYAIVRRFDIGQAVVTRDEIAFLSDLGVVSEYVDIAADVTAIDLLVVDHLGGAGGLGRMEIERLASDPSLPGGLGGDVVPEVPAPGGGGVVPGGGGGFPGGVGPTPEPEPRPFPEPEPRPFPEPEPSRPGDLRDRFDVSVAMPSVLAPYIPEAVDSVDVSQAQRAHEFDEALERLAGLDTSKLERLMTETLDAAHYRRDAWTSSIHTRHLEQMRAKRRLGSHLGAYGFVLGLRQELEPIEVSPRQRRSPQSVFGGRRDTNSKRLEQGGFIAAHTPDQAAALAVVRNAYLAHANDGNSADALRMNLNSTRVRVALELIDAVREANPPADVLGARFERLLHRRNQEVLDAGQVSPDGGIAQYLLDFRDQYPNRAGGDDPEGRRNRVVDGVQLVQAWQANQLVTELLPNVTLPAQHLVELAAILDELEGQVDAANDLLLFEATFLATTGDSAAATRALDAHAGMAASSPITSVSTPAAGPGFTHRIVVPLADLGNSWGGPRNLAATVSPRLNDWAGMLLGEAAEIVWAYKNSFGEWVPHTLADIELDPLDLILGAERWARSAISGGAAADDSDASGEQLVQHLRAFALTQPGMTVVDPVAIRVDRAFLSAESLLDGGIAVSEIAELALRAARTLRSARPLEPADLVAAGTPADAHLDLDEAAARLAAGAAVLAELAEALDAAAAKIDATAEEDLSGVDAEVVAVVVRANASGTQLDSRRPSRMTEAFRQDHLAALRNAAARLRNKVAQDPDITSGANLTTAAANLVSRDVPFDIQFDLIAAEPLKTALAGQPKVDGSPLRAWFQQIARVLPDATDLELAILGSEASRRSEAGKLWATQLPWEDDEPWIGGELDPTTDDLDGSGIQATTSICAVGPGTVRAQAMSGLFIGVVNDRVPLPDHTGGIAFRYDQPSARAPQVVAIAVPATTHDFPAEEPADGEPEPGWRWAHLVGAIDSMIEDAQLRAADPNKLEGVGPALPMTLYPTQPEHAFYDIDLEKLAGAELARGGDQ